MKVWWNEIANENHGMIVSPITQAFSGEKLMAWISDESSWYSVSIMISLLISTLRYSFLLDYTWRPAGASILSLPGAHDYNPVNISLMDHSPYCHLLPGHPTGISNPCLKQDSSSQASCICHHTYAASSQYSCQAENHSPISLTPQAQSQRFPFYSCNSLNIHIEVSHQILDTLSTQSQLCSYFPNLTTLTQVRVSPVISLPVSSFFPLSKL